VTVFAVQELSVMNTRMMRLSLAAVALTGSLFASVSGAAPVNCQDTTKNYMKVDSAYVTACLDAGVGNINGNALTDDYLLGGGTGTLIGASPYTQNGKVGTFTVDGNLWNSWSSISLGFKFGTGNQPDEWFVYSLVKGVTSGSWEFVNTFGKGGGLSHTVLYGTQRTTRVPEPATLAIFGLGLLGFAGTALRKRK
jgi:hypothetical protein